jgi:hypothetical protein
MRKKINKKEQTQTETETCSMIWKKTMATRGSSDGADREPRGQPGGEKEGKYKSQRSDGREHAEQTRKRRRKNVKQMKHEAVRGTEQSRRRNLLRTMTRQNNDSETSGSADQGNSVKKEDQSLEGERGKEHKRPQQPTESWQTERIARKHVAK